MTQFENVAFNSSPTTKQLITDQLERGLHRGRGDSAASDWVVRAWQALPAKEAGWVADAVHDALTHPDPTVRAEAVRALQIAPRMADPDSLLNLAQNQMHLFRGLRRDEDSPNKDRGSDFVQLVASVAEGAKGRAFRRQMARDRQYGLHVLAALTQDEPEWVVAQSAVLLNPTIDPDGTRLNVVLFNLRHDPDRLQQLVTQLHREGVVGRERLLSAVRAKLRPSLQQTLLDLLA